MCTWSVEDQGQSLGGLHIRRHTRRKSSCHIWHGWCETINMINQFKTDPWIPYQEERRVIWMSWLMVSNAAERSSRQRQDSFCEPMAFMRWSWMYTAQLFQWSGAYNRLTGGDWGANATVWQSSCVHGDTICPRPSPPRGPQAPLVPPSRRNVAVVSHAQYVLKVTAAPASRVKAAVSKAACGDLDLWPFDFESGVKWSGYLCANFSLLTS